MSEVKKEDHYVVALPFFNGFYESSLSSQVDSHEEREAEWFAERETHEEESEYYQPLHLRITTQEYGELFFKHTDYQKTYLKIAQLWVEAFDEWCKESINTPPKSFVWETMTSPKEYNFTTDRVYAYVPKPVIEMLFNRSAEGGLDEDRVCDECGGTGDRGGEVNGAPIGCDGCNGTGCKGHKTLADVIKATFTSYDGFMSFYSNDIDAWLEKPLEEWDYNEMGTLVAASIKSSDEFEGRWEFYNEIEALMFTGNGEMEEALEIDWAAFEAGVEKLRSEKLAAYNVRISDGQIHFEDLDVFTRHYIIAALWATTDTSDNMRRKAMEAAYHHKFGPGEPDEALNRNYEPKDISQATLLVMKDDCAKFQKDNAADLTLAYASEEYRTTYNEHRDGDCAGGIESLAGHDFWLTRAGAGCGFWGRGLEEIGDRLTEACKWHGEFTLSVGDDGEITHL